MPQDATERSPLIASRQNDADFAAAELKADSTELPFVPGLGLIAVVWIAASSYLMSWSEDWRGNLVTNRPLHLLTVLAGFTTHLRYARREDIGGVFSFMARRTSRVYVLYLLTMSMAWLLHTIWTFYFEKGALYSLLFLACNIIPCLLGLNAWFSAIPVLFSGVEAVPSVLAPVADNALPVSTILWFIQGLMFCWFCYPLFRPLLAASTRSTIRSAALIFIFWLLALLPGIVCVVADASSSDWHTRAFVAHFPPFLVPSFMIGVAASDLLLLEEEKASGPTDKAWHGHAGGVGELLLVFAVLMSAGITFSPYIQPHFLSPLWALSLFYLAASSWYSQRTGERPKGGMGLAWLLETQGMAAVGGAALAALLLQSPLNVLFYWATGSGIDWHLYWHQFGLAHWMSAPTFFLFLLCLLPLAFLIQHFLIAPASAALADKVKDAVKDDSVAAPKLESRRV